MSTKRIKEYLLILVLLVLGLFFAFPFIWMILSSFKNATDVTNITVFFPKVWQWKNYLDAFTHQPFARQYFNSFYIALTVTLGTVLIGALSGYAFARVKFPGRNFIFLLILSGLMVPVEVAIIPNFFLMRDLNLTNTHFPLIVIPMLGARGVMASFMLRQFFLGIPLELEEAARIDGLKAPGIFARIFLPLSGSAVSTVVILTFLHTWNNFLEPLVYINDIELYTIPLALNNFTGGYGLPMQHVQLAATVMSVLPILTIYLLAQDKITASMAGSGMKG